MADKLVELIEQARAEHHQTCAIPEHPDDCSGTGCAEVMCTGCEDDYPCLTARLADALEVESADWSERLDEREEILRQALVQRDAAKARAERLAGYTRHSRYCRAQAWGALGPCDCGLSAALGLAEEPSS